MNLFLISNGSEGTFPNNTLTNFKNKLPTTIELEKNQNWCVAVESVGFSTNFRNIELPENPEAPSFIISNCKIDVPKCDKMCTRSSTGKYICTDEECAIQLTFRFEDNEDNENCFWKYFRFEDKFYTYYDLESYFSDVVEKDIRKYIDIGITPDRRFGVLNIDDYRTNKDLWILFSESMMSTFNIPKYFPLEATDYLKKTGKGKYIIVRRYFDGLELIHNELPYITYYKSEKYYAFRLESQHKVGGKVNLYGRTENNISLRNRIFPKLVKIASEDVKQQIFNSQFSKDLLCFCPDFNKEDKYFFQEFENRQYVPLSSSIITDLNVKLVDNNNQYLQLLKGVPTIIKLDIKKMDIDEQFFNLRLTSVKDPNFPKNTKSSFKVKLPNTLSLDRSWKVCLTSISHPNTFKTFLSDDISRKILIRSDNTVYQFALENKVYTNNDLVKLIDQLLKDSFLGSASLKDGKIEFLFVRDDIEFLASNDMLKILGFNGKLNETLDFTQIVVKKDEHFQVLTYSEGDGLPTKTDYIWYMPLPVDVSYLRPDYIIAYTNIVSPTIMGGNYSKILRVIPIKTNDNEFVVTEFHHKEFLELQNTEINEIEIELRAHDGTLINFGFDQDVILNLEFRVHNV